MCTVTFVPVGDQLFITSNRDEKAARLPAEPPLLRQPFGTALLYPQDAEKGGTWIGMNKRGECGVLLNGAKKPHTPQYFYRHSRGLILPWILSSSNPVEAFSEFDTSEIEPFTLVLYTQKRLYECRWDGHLKCINRLPGNRPHIWSSSTLYDTAMQEKREAWFALWLKENRTPSHESIKDFHQQGGEGKAEIDFVMNRNNVTLTVSITSIALDAEKAVMTYHRLDENKIYRNELSLSNSKELPLSRWWQRFSIRLLHWEYWPFQVVYAPIYPYWFWLCLKARSLFFFNASNPTIRNGGFLMESKKEIYDLMPAGSYPKTLLVEKEKHRLDDVLNLIRYDNLSYPFIAKPDIGLRGIAVKLIRTAEELKTYHQQSKVDYLIQAYVPYNNEVGIFYCRMPGTKEGKITGIVGKELLRVTGDGVLTIKELITKEKRFLLQLDALQESDPVLLTQVLDAGETKLLVPYGNHSRGAKFIDLSHLTSDKLTETINTLCLPIRGFYFGRLDIRYNTWEELCAGKNFSVIELNGAGS